MLVLVVVTVPFFTPHFGHSGQGIAIALTLGVAAVAWSVWNFAGDRPRLWIITLALMGAAGGALAGLSSASTAVTVGFVVAVTAGARLSPEVSAAIVAETVAAFLIAGIVSGAAPSAIIGWTAGFIGLWAFGLTRRAYLLRAIEAEQALEQARRARAAETQAAALAERARIAREIHDVLAHSLGALGIISLGDGAVTPMVSALLSFASPPDAQGEMLGFAQGVAGLGRVIGPLAAGSAYAIGGAPAPFLLGSVFVVLAAVIALPVLSIKHEVPLRHTIPDMQPVSTVRDHSS